MKRTSLHIVFIYFTVLLTMAATCNDQNINRMDRKSMEAARLKNGFESDSLSEPGRMAFEERAIQKLYDFADYANICSDKQLEKGFRDQAGEMIAGLFYTDSAKINPVLINPATERNISPGNFIHYLSGTKYHSLLIKISGVETIEHLYAAPGGIYSGRLNFIVRTSGIAGNDTLSIVNSRMSVKIIAARKHKNFGSEERYLWNVFLGDMENKESRHAGIGQ
jgi:hypothetical protein